MGSRTYDKILNIYFGNTILSSRHRIFGNTYFYVEFYNNWYTCKLQNITFNRENIKIYVIVFLYNNMHNFRFLLIVTTKPHASLKYVASPGIFLI